ncbi:MAG: hypothetical protein IH600_08515 [Bacteroidetes bacterium]|nr:hypothetical protein [Bacteroidota bacterium]
MKRSLLSRLTSALTYLTGAAAYVLLAILLSAYGNKDMHPAINEPIIDAFVDHFVNSLTRPESLKHYVFVFQGSAVFEGPAVTNGGYFASSTGESMVSKTPREWLMHGGYSADEPEVPAALRHFYDPFGIDGGKKYLTDRGTYWEFIINNYFINPQIDAKQWALHHADNPWTWDKGKEWMRKALAEPDETKRDQYMARAWRCLGETLHLVADMGCPPHVRNDSHAAPVGWTFRAALGDPDPYEELVKPSFAAKYAKGGVDPSLKTAVRAADKADVIFEELAKFTNSNFFTAQTISGTGVKAYSQIIRPGSPYSAPKLESMSYSPGTYKYSKTFPGGQTVVMCKDEGFFLQRCYPYMDEECVESQSSVLMPNIMEAGANAMRLFVPKLTVSISSAKPDGIVEGSVEMKTDAEYTSASTVVGRIFLLVKNKIVGEGALRSDGGFKVTGVAIKDKDEIEAEYRIGGMFIRSEPYTVGDPGFLQGLLATRAVLLWFSATQTYTSKTIDELLGFGYYGPEPSIGLAPLAWSGRNFSFQLDWTSPQDDHHIFDITGSVSADGRTVTSFNAYDMSSQQGGWHIETTRLALKNLPFGNYPYSGGGDYEYGIEGRNAKDLFVSMTRSVHDYDGQGHTTDYDYVSTNWDAGSMPYIFLLFYR